MNFLCRADFVLYIFKTVALYFDKYRLISAVPLYKDESQVSSASSTIRMRKKSGKRNKNSQERNRWRRVAEQLKETPFACFFTTIYFIQISPPRTRLSNNFYLPSSSSSLPFFLEQLTIHFTTVLSRLLLSVAEIYSFEKESNIIANKITKFFPFIYQWEVKLILIFYHIDSKCRLIK